MKPRTSPFTALQFRDFRLLWIGMLISRIGTEMQVVAINWQTYLLTSSALSLGLIGLSRFLPVLFVSPISGVAADKFDRKKIMFVATLGLTIVSLFLTLCSFTHHVSPLLIYIVIALQSFFMVFDTPARQSIVPLLVPKKNVIHAVSINTIMWQSSILLGPALGGFIIAYFGVSTVYLLNTISYIAVLIAILFMGEVKQEKITDASFSLNTVKEGLSFVKNTPIIYSSMLLDFFATFFSSATVLLPIFAKDMLHVGPQGLGFLYAAPAIGAVVAGLFFSSLGHVKKQGKIVIVAVCLYGLGTILFGLSRSFWLSLFFLSFIGAGDMISSIIRNTMRQLATPDSLRGRMISTNMIFFMGGPQLGEAEAGFLAFVVGGPVSVVIGGVATIVAALSIGYFVPKLRNYQGHDSLNS